MSKTRLLCYGGLPGRVQAGRIAAVERARGGKVVPVVTAYDRRLLASDSGNVPLAGFQVRGIPTMDYHDSLSRRKGMRRLSVVRLIRSSYLLYFSQPAADRALWRAIKRQPIRSIVEIGLGLCEAAAHRTERMLEVAGWRRDCLPLAYTGIDLFESRPAEQPRLTLKEAFGSLRATGAKTRLVPGDPYSAIARTANALTGTDLLVISAQADGDSLAQAWRFVPRMIHAQTLIFMQDSGTADGKALWLRVQHEEVLRWAADSNRAVRRAA